MRFKHIQAIDNYSKRQIKRLPFVVLLFNIFLWTADLDSIIKVFGSVILVPLAYIFFNIPAYQDKSIIIDKGEIVITEQHKRTIFKSHQIESIKSQSGLKIKLKDNTNIKISYSDWDISFKKAQELQAIIQQLIAESTSKQK